MDLLLVYYLTMDLLLVYGLLSTRLQKDASNLEVSLQKIFQILFTTFRLETCLRDHPSLRVVFHSRLQAWKGRQSGWLTKENGVKQQTETQESQKGVISVIYQRFYSYFDWNSFWGSSIIKSSLALQTGLKGTHWHDLKAHLSTENQFSSAYPLDYQLLLLP